MGEARRRAAVQNMISVLIPERGRPKELERLLRSLIDTAGDDAQIEILVAVDDDDELRQFIFPRQHGRFLAEI